MFNTGRIFSLGLLRANDDFLNDFELFPAL